MSDTGATPEQIEAAVERSLAALRRDCGIDGPRRDQEVLMGLAAAMLVPPGARIVEPDDLKAIAGILDAAAKQRPPFPPYIERLAALIGDADALA